MRIMDIELIPALVKGSLIDPSDREIWRQEFNKLAAYSSYEESMTGAFGFFKAHPNCRYFEGWASVDTIDKQGDVMKQEPLAEALLKHIERGGAVLDSHTNRPIGAIHFAELRPYDEQHKGVFVKGTIFQGEELFDRVWADIRKGTKRGFSIGGFALDYINKCNEHACYREVVPVTHELSAVNNPAVTQASMTYVNELAKAEDTTMIATTTNTTDSPVEIVKEEQLLKPKEAESTDEVEKSNELAPETRCAICDRIEKAIKNSPYNTIEQELMPLIRDAVFNKKAEVETLTENKPVEEKNIEKGIEKPDALSLILSKLEKMDEITKSVDALNARMQTIETDIQKSKDVPAEVKESKNKETDVPAEEIEECSGGKDFKKQAMEIEKSTSTVQTPRPGLAPYMEASRSKLEKLAQDDQALLSSKWGPIEREIRKATGFRVFNQ